MGYISRNRFLRTLTVLGASLAFILGGCQPSRTTDRKTTSPIPSPSPQPFSSALISPLDRPAPSSWPAGRVLYHSDQTGGHQIYLVTDGKSPQPLTEPPLSAVEPSWSPDGEKITFAAGTNASTGIEIYVMDADGGNRRKIMDEQPRLNWRPKWSPDGTQVLFQSNRDDNYEIYKVNLDGTSLTNLTNHAGNDYEADWAPDRDKIVFVSDRGEGAGAALYEMAPDGSAVTPILDASWVCALPKWSLDGKRITFASKRDGTWDIYVMQADGSDVRRVTDRVGDNTTPTWAHNDQLIFAGEMGDFSWDLFLVNVDGSGLVNLTNTVHSERFPDWAP